MQNLQMESLEPTPLVSIVTPVFNGARFLPQTIQSIRAQSYKNIEYIVVDGGSTDGTREIIAANRDIIAKTLSEKDRGMYDAVNKGFRLSTGRILAWVNSDDMLMPWAVNCVVEYFQRCPECAWATGIPAIWDENGNLAYVFPFAPHYRRNWIRRRWYSPVGLGIIQQESTFWRRELMDKAGPPDPNFRSAGDMDLWCRFAEHADLHQLGTVISGFRQHDSNLTDVLNIYSKEGRAVRIPGGLLLGAVYSFLMDRWRCFRRKPQVLQFLIPPKSRNR